MVANNVSLVCHAVLLKAALAWVWHGGPECDCAGCLENGAPLRGSCLVWARCVVCEAEKRRAVFSLFREFVFDSRVLTMANPEVWRWVGGKKEKA